MIFGKLKPEQILSLLLIVIDILAAVVNITVTF